MSLVADRQRTAERSLWRVFHLPIWIGFASLIGLVAALVGDGWYDIVGWLGLSVPVVASLWSQFIPRRR